jgi:hypothetical protein
MNFLVRYNAMQHRSEPHSRLEDWLENLPPSGVQNSIDSGGGPWLGSFFFPHEQKQDEIILTPGAQG